MSASTAYDNYHEIEMKRISKLTGSHGENISTLLLKQWNFYNTSILYKTSFYSNIFIFIHYIFIYYFNI